MNEKYLKKYKIINKIQRIIRLYVSNKYNKNKIIRIKFNSYLRILKFLSSKEENANKNKNLIGINYYEKFILSFINYFNNWKYKIKKRKKRNKILIMIMKLIMI